MNKSNSPVRFQCELTRSTTGSGWHFLIFGNEIAAKLGFEGKFKRVICSINGAKGFQCALMPWGELFYIIVNKGKREALGIVEGDTVDVELIRDESKYGLPMPPELKEVLKQDTKGDRLFHKLSEGKQRSILYFVGKIKDIDRRIHASLIVLEHLKENDGKVIDKKLHEELKRPSFDIGSNDEY